MDVPQRMVAVARQFASDAGTSTVKEAIEYYRKAILQSQPGSTLFLIAQQRLAGCYLLAGRWEEATQTYETLVMTYFNRREVPYWMKSVEELGKRRLHEPARAHNLAVEFFKRYPQRRSVVEPWLKQ